MRDHLRFTAFACALGAPSAWLSGGALVGASASFWECCVPGTHSVEPGRERTAQALLDRDDVMGDADEHAVPRQTPG